MPDELDWDPWPEDFVEEIASNYLITEGKFTITGSWIRDREEYPGLWRCVFESIAITKHAEQIVENTLDVVTADG